MKTLFTFISVLGITLSLGFTNLKAQEEEEASIIDAGLDIYSSYIWRGTKFGSGPALQPWVEGTAGNIAIGAWGSVNGGQDEAFEMDLYASYSFEFGLSIGITDYYFGFVDGDSIGVHHDGSTLYEQFGFFSYNTSHYIEPTVSYEAGNLSLTAAYLFYPDFKDGDMYFEAGYSIKRIEIALGAGDGAYTDDGDFMLCNITIGTSKDVKVTESYSIPISGSVTLNPSTEGFFIYAGISF